MIVNIIFALISVVCFLCCIGCRTSAGDYAEYAREHAEEARWLVGKSKEIFRERKDRLEKIGYTNIDVDEVSRIQVKVLEVMNACQGNASAMKLAVMETLAKELKEL